jgi:hypothetical protein
MRESPMRSDALKKWMTAVSAHLEARRLEVQTQPRPKRNRERERARREARRLFAEYATDRALENAF